MQTVLSRPSTTSYSSRTRLPAYALKSRQAVDEQRTLVTAINSASMVFLLAYYLLPVFAWYTRAPGNLLALAVWVLTSHMLRPYWYVRAGRYWIWALVLVFWMIVKQVAAGAFGIGSVSVLLLGWANFLFPAFAYTFYCQEGASRRMKTITRIALWLFLVTSVTTLLGLARDPIAARILATGDPQYTFFYSLQNVAGFFFIYALVILSPALLYQLKRSKRFPFFFILALYLLSLWLVFKSSYTIALIALAFINLITIIIIFTRTSLPFALVIVGIGALVFGVIVLSWATTIGPIVANTVYSERLSQLRDLFVYGSSTGRTIVYSETLNQLGNSWLIGGVVGGGHMEWLDHFLRFGLVGTLPLVLLGLGIYRNARANAKRHTNIIGLSFLAVLALGLVNNISSAAVGVVAFFVIPVLCLDEGSKGSLAGARANQLSERA